MLIVGYATTMKWIFFLRKRSDLAEIVVPFMQNIDRKVKRVKVVQFDNLGENKVVHKP